MGSSPPAQKRRMWVVSEDFFAFTLLRLLRKRDRWSRGSYLANINRVHGVAGVLSAHVSASVRDVIRSAKRGF